LAFGFPAKEEEARRYNQHYDYLSYAAANAVNALGWKYTTYTPYQFGLRTSLSFWSWGELISIDIYSDGTIFIRSECSFPIQMFDWGKNGRNIRQFFQMLDYFIYQYPPQPASQ
jgi:hypothetical protein